MLQTFFGMAIDQKLLINCKCPPTNALRGEKAGSHEISIQAEQTKMKPSVNKQDIYSKQNR